MNGKSQTHARVKGTKIAKQEAKLKTEIFQVHTNSLRKLFHTIFVNKNLCTDAALCHVTPLSLCYCNRTISKRQIGSFGVSLIN